MMRKELCRNFQRGSCQYGARCKFVHATPQQQQQQKAGGFGFGAQAGFQQQQNSNPFGFGVKSNPQLGGAADSGPRRDQAKPFSNQWTRNQAAPSSRSADRESQPANHICTDPDACKRLIVEDIQNERPLWKLTSYTHWKHLPCDIVGDISYEELRAAAYDDARHGLSVRAIVERERSLVNSKLAEFDNLRRNPYVPRSNSSLGQNSFPNAPSNAFASNASPPVVSTFSQAASLGGIVGPRPTVPTVTAFGNQNPFQAIGSSGPFSNSGMTPGMFGSNNVRPGSIGPNNNQFPAQIQVNSLPLGTQSNNTNAFGSMTNMFSAATTPPQVVDPANSQNQQSMSSFGQTTTEVKLMNSTPSEIKSGDAGIWMKETWTPGEIPEEAPPDEFV